MEFISEEVTVNKTRCKEILGRLRDFIRRKRSELWRTKNWLLLHKSALASSLCLCPRGTCKSTNESFSISSVLIWSRTVRFFLPLVLQKSSWLPQEKPYGNFLSTAFSGANSRYINVSKRAHRLTATILKEDMVLIKCTPCNSPSCYTYRFMWVPFPQSSSHIT